MKLTTSQPKVALTGPVGLEVLAAYFREAGYDVMRETDSMADFKPDSVYDVTSREKDLAAEVPGFYDERMMKIAGHPYSLAGLKAIVDEFSYFLLASRRKVLAVDADNTLYRGIASEDGFAALKPYAIFQEGLRTLRDAGVVIVLLSKNDSLDYLKAAPVDFSLFSDARVNWAGKPGNLIEICRALNLPTDSVVFVDDSPHERAQMSAHLPEVAVLPWNGFPEENEIAAQRQLVRRLKDYFFVSAPVTEEDRLRAADYRRRQALAPTAFASREDYLRDLALTVHPGEATEADLDRLEQMSQKTNQFNATTRRMTRADFVACLREGKRIFVFRAADRFGEQGLVLYLIYDPASRRITDFVMSCRAMGRTLEHFALGYVERALGFRPEIDFVPSAKNAPFAAFHATRQGELKTFYTERK